ncbi:MAG: hypothetical protein AB7V77_01310 [Candidatus Woesearchaeota archaeon]
MRQIKLISIFAFLFLISSILVIAEIDTCSSKSACGISPPQSQYGFGAVQICDTCFVCNKVKDGVCPEDFTDGTQQGSCAMCPDGDCTVEVSGKVYLPDRPTVTITTPLTIYAYYANSVEGIKVNTTNSKGEWKGIIPSGKVYFLVKDTYYDSDLVNKTLIRSEKSYTDINIPLYEGLCNSDCTGTAGYCKASCQGINNCTYQDVFQDAFRGGAYPITTAEEIATLCDYVRKDNQIYITEDDDFIYNYECCVGDIVKIKKQQVSIISGNFEADYLDIKNFRSTAIPVTYNGQVYNLVFNVWAKD